jgi:hypothetical protein
VTAAAQELAYWEPEVARRAVELTYERVPGLAEAYGPAGRARCLEDFRFHVRFLLSSLVIEDDAVFADYAGWTRRLLERHGIPPSHLTAAFGALADAVAELAPAAAAPVGSLLEAGESALRA